MNTDHPTQYSWSTDGEGYRDQCDSHDAAIAAAVDYHGGDLAVGQTIHIGEVVEVDSLQLVDADSVIDNMQVQAHDFAGEASEDYLAVVTDEQKAELQQLIAAWADRIEMPSFWRVVNSTPHVITAEDLA